MKKKQYIPLLTVSVLLACGSSLAAEPSTIKLQDSYVHPDYVEVERLKDTKEVIVIQKKDIQEKGYTSLSDILKDVPSINVGLTGQGDIDIRGQGSDQSARNLQVLLDGAPITSVVNHPLKTNYDVVPVENIEKIEIIPGGGSVLYGSGASGGVINITTSLRTMNQVQNTLNTEWNSDGEKLNLNIGSKVNDKLTVTAGYSKINRNLYFKNTYRNSDYVYGGFRYDIDKNQRLTVRASHLEEDSRYIGNISISKMLKEGKNYVPAYQTVTVGLDADGHKITEQRRDYLNGDRHLDSYNMTYESSIGSNWRFIGDFFYNKGYYSNTDTDDKRMYHDTKGAKLKFDYSYGSGKQNNLLLGLDIYRQKANLDYNNYKLVNYRTKTYTLEPLSFNYDKKVEALYALNVMNKKKWTFTQGLRRERLLWDFDKQAASGLSGADESNRWNTAAELSAAYHYNDTGRIYARWERGFTSADGLQITDETRIDGYKRYVTTGADDEIFNMYEVGWRDKIGASTISLTGFYSYTDNQMNRFYIFDAQNHLNMKTMNILKTQRKGIDLSIQQHVGKWKFTEGYTYLKGRSNYNGAGEAWMAEHPKDRIDYTKSGLMKVPKHKVMLRADYAFNKKFNMGATYTYIGKYNNFLSDADKYDNDGGIIGSHSLVDIDAHYKVNKNLEVFGGITNLFNKTYYEYESGIGPYSTITAGSDRTYYGGVKYTF